jgi:hypothetical protein
MLQSDIPSTSELPTFPFLKDGPPLAQRGLLGNSCPSPRMLCHASLPGTPRSLLAMLRMLAIAAGWLWRVWARTLLALRLTQATSLQPAPLPPPSGVFGVGCWFCCVWTRVSSQATGIKPMHSALHSPPRLLNPGDQVRGERDTRGRRPAVVGLPCHPCPGLQQPC